MQVSVLSFDWAVIAVSDTTALFQVKSYLFLFCHGDNAEVNQGFKKGIFESSMVVASKDIAQVEKDNIS